MCVIITFRLLYTNDMTPPPQLHVYCSRLRTLSHFGIPRVCTLFFLSIFIFSSVISFALDVIWNLLLFIVLKIIASYLRLCSLRILCLARLFSNINQRKVRNWIYVITETFADVYVRGFIFKFVDLYVFFLDVDEVLCFSVVFVVYVYRSLRKMESTLL